MRLWELLKPTGGALVCPSFAPVATSFGWSAFVGSTTTTGPRRAAHGRRALAPATSGPVTRAATPDAPTTIRHRPALDGFRGATVVLVLVGHLGFGKVAGAGSVGVTLFFVLSGFLITRLLVDEVDRTGSVHLAHFFARRALRLLPALAAVLVVVGIWAALSPTVVAPLRATALQVANVAASQGRDLGVLGHTWSLSLEGQFYLLWPFVILAARRRIGLAIAAATLGFVASLAAAVVLLPASSTAPGWERLHFGPDTRSYALFAGCLVALTLHRLPSRRILAALVPLALAIPVAASLLDGRSAAFSLGALPLTALAGALLTAHLFRGTGGVLEAVCGWGPLRYLGRISYGLYLWHIPVFVALQPLVIDLPLGMRSIIRVALSIAVASVSFHYLEQPALASKRRFRGADGLSPVPATSTAVSVAIR